MYGHSYFRAGLCHEDSRIPLMLRSLDRKLSSVKHLCHSEVFFFPVVTVVALISGNQHALTDTHWWSDNRLSTWFDPAPKVSCFGGTLRNTVPFLTYFTYLIWPLKEYLTENLAFDCQIFTHTALQVCNVALRHLDLTHSWRTATLVSFSMMPQNHCRIEGTRQHNPLLQC